MRYENLDPAHRRHSLGTVLRWALLDRLTGRRRIAPPGPPAPEVTPDLESIARPGGPPRLTWLGHAGFLLHLGEACCLIDPVFSRRIGGFYPRHGTPPLTPARLPPLAALMISHSHYDHLDTPSVCALPRQVPVIVPTGLGRWLRRHPSRHPQAGGPWESVHELAWWQSVEAGPLRITLVPARHWSKRTFWDTNRSLWGGFVIETTTQAGKIAVYHAGDTGFFDTFDEIARRFPDLHAAILPIGAYDPPWFMEPNHMNPEQAGEAFRRLGARTLIPMHWGTFQLTDESLREPEGRLRAWWQQHRPEGRLVIPAVGETVEL